MDIITPITFLAPVLPYLTKRSDQTAKTGQSDPAAEFELLRRLKNESLRSHSG
jgi:hypothetical protein